jgi:hypothetical protein
MAIPKQIRSIKIPIGLLSILLFISPGTSFSQLPGYEQRNGASIHLAGTIFLNELLKDTYKQNQYADIKGSPFYKDEWKNASIVLKDGKQFNGVKVKLNLHSHEFVCLSAPNSEIMLKDGIVDRLVLYDTNESRRASIHVFASGIPLVEKDITYPIFEVLTEGKASLFKLIKKKITNVSDALSGADQKEFVASESLYVFFNSELRKCAKNADFYAKLFSDKKEKVEEFIKISKLKCRNPEEAIVLVNYYNSL